MAKKQEDNRDVFDKALDYAAPVVGAVAGGAIARRIGGMSRSTRKALEKKRMEETLRMLEGKPNKLGRVADELASDSSARGMRTLYGASVGGATGAYFNYAKDMEKKKRRK
jgi:hypothetical protein